MGQNLIDPIHCVRHAIDMIEPTVELQSLDAPLPMVSWLLCTHVADAQLRLAMQSCLDQTYVNFELLAVVNGPRVEQVANAVREWYGNDGRVRIFTTEVRDLSFSLSLGLHYARGEFIARMDSDDLSKSDRLQRQICFMQNHPNVGVLGSAYEIIDAQGCVQKSVFLPTDDAGIRRAMLWMNPICHPSVMLRRTVALLAGGYLGGGHAEDYELWIRLAAHSDLQFANLPDVCLGYRQVGVGFARRSRSAYASVAAFQFRHFINGYGGRWLFAAFFTMLKAFVRSSRPKDVR